MFSSIVVLNFTGEEGEEIMDDDPEPEPWPSALDLLQAAPASNGGIPEGAILDHDTDVVSSEDEDDEDMEEESDEDDSDMSEDLGSVPVGASTVTGHIAL